MGYCYYSNEPDPTEDMKNLPLVRRETERRNSERRIAFPASSGSGTSSESIEIGEFDLYIGERI